MDAKKKSANIASTAKVLTITNYETMETAVEVIDIGAPKVGEVRVQAIYACMARESIWRTIGNQVGDCYLGVVTAVGNSVFSLAVDDLVLCLGAAGGIIQSHMNVKSRLVIKIPRNLPKAKYMLSLASPCALAEVIFGDLMQQSVPGEVIFDSVDSEFSRSLAIFLENLGIKMYLVDSMRKDFLGAATYKTVEDIDSDLAQKNGSVGCIITDKNSVSDYANYLVARGLLINFNTVFEPDFMKDIIKMECFYGYAAVEGCVDIEGFLLRVYLALENFTDHPYVPEVPEISIKKLQQILHNDDIEEQYNFIIRMDELY